jgi:hypothetical protein
VGLEHLAFKRCSPSEKSNSEGRPATFRDSCLNQITYEFFELQAESLFSLCGRWTTTSSRIFDCVTQDEPTADLFEALNIPENSTAAFVKHARPLYGPVAVARFFKSNFQSTVSHTDKSSVEPLHPVPVNHSAGRLDAIRRIERSRS